MIAEKSIKNKKESVLRDKYQSLNMNTKYAITTIDNPFDPFNDFTRWLLFDNEKGYGTCQYLARIANISEMLSDEENNEEVGRAIDEIVALDLTGTYKKLINPNYKPSF